MSEFSRSRWFLPALTIMLTLVSGCGAVDGTTSEEDTRAGMDEATPAVEGVTPKEDTEAGIEQWECGDYPDGCGFLATDCVTLTASPLGVGGVKFGEFVEFTQFGVEGIERRWDRSWDGDRFEYSFVISVDGTGRYYNFRSSDDGRAKPSDLFKCAMR